MRDNGVFNAVFVVESDKPEDNAAIYRWKYTVPIFVENVNNAPEFVTVLADTMKAAISPPGTFEQVVTAKDADIEQGKRDTLIIGYSIHNLADKIYVPQVEPVFVDSGNGSASFLWTPMANEIGNYKLQFYVWDYYRGIDSAKTVLWVIGTHTGVNDEALPREFQLYQNVPNPFNPITSIHYQLSMDGDINLSIYNVYGQLVRTLAQGEQVAGRHVVEWDGLDETDHKASSGVYLYRLQAGAQMQTRKLMLMK